MKVIISGIGGYIGSVTAELFLRAGHEVTGIDNFIYKNQGSIHHFFAYPKFKLRVLDIRCVDMVAAIARDADAIIPLAAIVGAPACEKNPYGAQTVNYEAIANMCPLLRTPARIIYPNTNSGYGVTDGKDECVETDVLKPISTYGLTKCAAENYLTKSYPNTVVFRLATVFGSSPRMRFDLMVNDFVAKIKKLRFTESLPIFEPHFKRNFVHVRDVARAFLRAADPTLLDPGVYNLGLPDANLTKWELAEKIMGKYLPWRPDCLVVGDGRDPDQRNYVVSNKKILSTGFRFLYTLDDGIREVGGLCDLYEDYEIRKMGNV